MSVKMKVGGLASAAVLVVAATTYVFTAPYTRTAGVRIGGTMTPPPADFTTAFQQGIGLIKTGGFPPFVVHVVLVPFKGASSPQRGLMAVTGRSEPVRRQTVMYAVATRPSP